MTQPTNAPPHIFTDFRAFEGHEHIASLWRARVGEMGAQPAHREKHLGIWEAYSWADFGVAVRRIAGALKARGLHAGDCVSILSENRKEWAYADMAVQCLGGITVGVYQTDAPSQCAYILNDSGSKILIAENDEQLDKFLKIEDQCPALEWVVVLDAKGLEGFTHPKVLFWDALLAEDAPLDLDGEIDARDGDSVALLVYTSGTTGPPKGAQLTGRNIIASGKAAEQMFDAAPGETQFSFLPLAHIWERTNALYLPLFQKTIVCFAESPETIFDNMRELSPHYLSGVPRVWEKVYSTVSLRMKDATGVGKALYAWALRRGTAWAQAAMVGTRPRLTTRLGYAAANALVLANMRRAMGMDRCKRANSGAAPVSPALLKWFWAMGVPVFEGWGQTETMAIGTLNLPGANKIGTIGRATPHAAVRIDPETSEIQITGPHVFQGYLNLPEKTAETFTPDGWLKTGDVGRIDADGFVTITGRIKDIIITAGGKNITPAELENDLKFSPFISDAVIIGDGRKYLSALIMIDQDTVEKFAQDASIAYGDFKSLCAAPEIVTLIESEVEKVNANFARVEQIKKIRLIDQLLQAEDEELTPTMKLKRSFVEQKYSALVEAMYQS